MMKWIKKLKDEKGSATIEFLGIMPFMLLIAVIIWQLVVTIHGVVLIQSAANEAGKVYSITKDKSEAASAAQDIISTGSGYLTFQSAPISGDQNYTAEVNAKIRFVFLPKKYFGTTSYPFSSTAKGRVIE
ncbi:TadE family protein [Siminovitchia sp. FSL H7-0308]|uniref:Flp pilus assembly protein TadG n=1 Tax=Siminovitchia thermophila TaxID=1245522 RepID=A0ABS2R982_9BACI|nr:TadE family protein [Siminovitchia thermophila]MBM7715940.1 Flp pilus assembly protein TadG [Siminovitchia thermophila]